MLWAQNSEDNSSLPRLNLEPHKCSQPTLKAITCMHVIDWLSYMDCDERMMKRNGWKKTKLDRSDIGSSIIHIHKFYFLQDVDTYEIELLSCMLNCICGQKKTMQIKFQKGQFYLSQFVFLLCDRDPRTTRLFSPFFSNNVYIVMLDWSCRICRFEILHIILVRIWCNT